MENTEKKETKTKTGKPAGRKPAKQSGKSEVEFRNGKKALLSEKAAETYRRLGFIKK